MNEELLSLLGATPEQIAQAQRRSGYEELSLLGQALMQAGAPAPRGTSTLGRLGQAAGMYTQAPRQTMDTLLQDLLRRQQVEDVQKKREQATMTQTALDTFLNDPRYQSPELQALARINPAEALKTVMASQQTGGALGLDAQTQAFMQLTYGTTDFTKLQPDAQRTVLQFSNAPPAAKATELAQKAAELRSAGVAVPPLPTSREQFFAARPAPVAPTARAMPQAIPQQTTLAGSGGELPDDFYARRQRFVDSLPENVRGSFDRPGDMPQPTPQPEAPREAPMAKVNENVGQGLAPRDRLALKADLQKAMPRVTDSAQSALFSLKDTAEIAKKLLADEEALDAVSASGMLSGLATQFAATRPGTKAFEANALLENLQARNFVSEIQQMRQDSPTGGAVGSVAVQEMQSLSSIPAVLKAGASKEFLKDQLRQLVRRSEEAQKKILSAYERDYTSAAALRKALEQRSVVQIPQGQVPQGVTVKRKN